MAPKTNRRKNKRSNKRSKVPRAPRNGGFVITRRVPTLYLSNSSTFGAPQITQPSGGQALIALGSPVVHPIFGNNFTVPFALQFTLDQLSQYTDIQQIADRYKITDVYVKFQYSSNNINGATSGPLVPSVCWVPDHDDGSTLTPTELNAKMGLRRVSLGDGKFHLIKIKPRVAGAVFQGLSTGYMVPNSSEYINSSYPTVLHYGCKGYIDGMYLGGVGAFNSCISMDITYRVQVRDLQ